MKRRIASHIRVSERGFTFEEIEVDGGDLRQKLGSDGIPPNASQVALAAVERLQSEFEGWARKDIDRVRELGNKLRNQPSHADRAALCDELRRLAHDLRGQGATFDYPLITDLAEGLGSACRALHVPLARQADLVQRYAELISRILDRRIRGPGGREGDAVKKSAQRLADLAVPPDTELAAR